jgi:hypothetical protein
LDVLNAIRPRGSQGKEKGVIRADIHTSILVQMMKVKMYQIHVRSVKVIHVQLVKVVGLVMTEVEALEIRGGVGINF